MGMIATLNARLNRAAGGYLRSQRSYDPYSFIYSTGMRYPLYGLQQTIAGHEEEIPSDFTGYVQAAYRGNGVVFACMLARMMLFSEARFTWRQIRSGAPGKLFGTADLAVLEHPWPSGTTGDLLARAIVDVDLSGNAFLARRPGPTIKRMRPDWVTIILGSQGDPDTQAGDLDAEVLGYIYHPGGEYSGRAPVNLLREQVAHFAPIPDPLASYRGMSWLTPIVREIVADSAATTHKLKFFENGATPNMVVKLDPAVTMTAFDAWVDKFEAAHAGVLNAYKTLYLGAGAEATVVGADMRQIDFKVTQGAGETRIAAAAGVPPIIVGLSEGLQAATYSNYGQARRRFADGTMWPLWRNMVGSLETIVPPPAGSQLWVDDSDIPFLREDEKDRADIQSTQAQSIKALTDAGFDPTSVIDAITAGDLGRLSHTGLYSVQLQPPNPDGTVPPATQAGRALAALIEPYLNGKEPANVS